MAAIVEVMESTQFVMGPQVKAFESQIAAYLGTQSALSCASGSDALALALMALGIGVNDEVITTPFTFVATAGAVSRVGAKPVFADIEFKTFNINPNCIESLVTERTRAILPVHLFGLPANLDPILSLASKHDLAVIEDAAQAIGARYKGASVGTIGAIGCFSFFPSKNLGCAGDGGLMATDSSVLADQLRLLRVHGSPRKYHYEMLGMNSRLDTIQAAILQIKLRHLNVWNTTRRDKADCYRAPFAESNLTDIIDLPSACADSLHVYNQFVIRCSLRDELRDYLRICSIPTEIYYPLPLYLQPAFKYLNYKPGNCQNRNELVEKCSHCLSTPS